jgi:hypothetical protein
MNLDDPSGDPQVPGHWSDASPDMAESCDVAEFTAAVVIMDAERELMTAGIAGLQHVIDRAHKELTDARGDLAGAYRHGDPEVVGSARHYVDEVEAMFEQVSAASVLEMTATIEQALSNLESAIALIPPAIDARTATAGASGRDEEPGVTEA